MLQVDPWNQILCAEVICVLADAKEASGICVYKGDIQVWAGLHKGRNDTSLNHLLASFWTITSFLRNCTHGIRPLRLQIASEFLICRQLS